MQHRQQSKLDSSMSPFWKAGSELLPVPLELAKPFLQSLGRGLEIQGNLRVADGALGVLAALNFLHGAGWADALIFPDTRIYLGPEHIQLLRHLWCSTYAFFERGSVPFALDEAIGSLKERASDYSGGTVSVRRRLESAKVIPAWPKVGHACVSPIIALVDAELQAELESPESILLPESEWPEVTPTSAVHADDDEWYDVCVAGHEREMFVPIEEEKIFGNNLGEKVMMGAMGVEKIKEINGEKMDLLRFICILCPINAYMWKIMGASWSLPQSCLLATLILGAGEYIWQDGEDLESCFNLSTLPESWLPYFVFSKLVACSAFGGLPGKMTYVAMRAVPMGWTNSVALLQNFLRNLLYKTIGVPRNVDVNPRQRVLKGDAVVACMDGADYLTRLREVGPSYADGTVRSFPAPGNATRSCKSSWTPVLNWGSP